MSCNSRPAPVRGALALVAALAISGLTLTAAKAATITDPANDFLATYTGPHGGDLDVLKVGASVDFSNVTVRATLNGNVGTTAGGLYVLGVNRGAGTELLTLGTPPVGQGVFFDAVVVMFPNLTGQVVDFNGANPPTMHPLAAGAISVSGANITGVIPLAFLPSTGVTPASYTYNLWPRNGLVSNDQIADFAPDASSFLASVVPEPATWALTIVGVGLMGSMLRHRRRSVAATA